MALMRRLAPRRRRCTRHAPCLARVAPVRRVSACAAAILAAVLTLASIVPAAQDPATSTSASQPTFRTRSEGVRVDVLVTDGDKPVAGLKTADFELTDSGVPQAIDATSLSETPLDVILVLDTSSSLGRDGLAHLIRAADTLCARLRPHDRAALVTFAYDVTIRAPLTPQIARVRAGLRGLEAGGVTTAIDAIFAAMTLQGDGDRPTLLLVFSDGVDTSSWLQPRDVLDTARRSSAVPYAVVVGEAAAFAHAREGPNQFGLKGAPPSESERFLANLVQAGGGLFIDARATGELEQRFAEALDNFRRRYVLTYTPRGVERQGWHPLAVRVKGHRYRVRARPGYFVP